MNLTQKRPRSSPSLGDNMEEPQSKRAKPSLNMTALSPADRQALERVASMLQKPVAELWEAGTQNHPEGTSASTSQDSRRLPTPTSHWEPPSRATTAVDSYDARPNAAFPSPEPWNHFLTSGHDEGISDDIVFVPRMNDPFEETHVHSSFDVNQGGLESCSNIDFGCAAPWSHEPRQGMVPWRETPVTNFTQTHYREKSRSSDDPTRPLHITEYNPDVTERTTETPDVVPFPHLGRPSPTADHRLFLSEADVTLIDSDDDETTYKIDCCEGLPPLELPSIANQSSPEKATSSGWSVIERPSEQEYTQNASKTIERKASFEWVSNEDQPKDSLSRQPRRRGPFQDKSLQEETSETRKRKACVRCRMQKTRCLTNPNDPDGVCLTCQAVSKQKIHTIPCLRYKITECTLYRTGKAPGMEFTLRWPVMKLKDISDWAEPEVRTISIQSDMCPVPLDLFVRKFVPVSQDSLHRGWMDGKVKKFKEVTPFAIVNMTAALKDMQDHINTHVFRCMAAFIDGRDVLVQETYAFARKYMLIAPADEQRLLGNFFRIWFAIRRTATTEFIVSEDTIDMTPETKDPSYPLFGKVPLPPVMIHQLDMTLTLGLLQPLRKKVLEDFQKIVVANKPKSWMTIYLITFMLLHRSATLSAENYQNARKQGLKRRYTMPNFIAELHHGSNVFLTHYHYCTKPCDPFTMDWRKRQSTPFADMSTDEIHFLIRTAELVKERKDKFRVAKDIDLYEDDLYFISQMFEEEWVPRETVIGFEEGTVADVPLRRRFFSGRK